MKAGLGNKSSYFYLVLGYVILLSCLGCVIPDLTVLVYLLAVLAGVELLATGLFGLGLFTRRSFLVIVLTVASSALLFLVYIAVGESVGSSLGFALSAGTAFLIFWGISEWEQ